jgi:hypothetical protein
MAPADTERVPSGIGVDLVPFSRGEVLRYLQQPSAQLDSGGVSACRVLDVQVEVHLLRVSVGPFGRHVIRGELNTDPPLTVGVEDTVKRVVGEYATAEHRGPKGALSLEIGRIEHDDLSEEPHADILSISHVGRQRRFSAKTHHPARAPKAATRDTSRRYVVRSVRQSRAPITHVSPGVFLLAIRLIGAQPP